MATIDNITQKTQDTSLDQHEQFSVDNLGEALAKTDLKDALNSSSLSEENNARPPRPLHIYTRPQVLLLSKSPLVKPPDGMPSLKEWFGDWNEQVASKKEVESSGNAVGTRDRRFRRDAEEGEPPARPSFRSSLSQPSQMGNFRHQSLRTTERDRERDTERERQREERDREGQERLRNLSDKYDRDRLASISSSTTLRTKDREPAPHMTSGSSARGTQGQNGSTARRAEGRDTTRKKGESEDWRRGLGQLCDSGDDSTDAKYRDRDRERPRSRVRDSSRPRRETSTTRRDREREDRDRPRRGEDRDDSRRDSDDHSRRERDDYFRRDWDDRDRPRDSERWDRRDRDLDRDLDDDARRWRDDGRRDERQVTRRERERNERGWDRWEPSHDRERADDRDGRKRPTGRDRRSTAPDDKEKEDRREKEPAWMETYVPTTPGAGILGGQGGEGELDGIQAWKKGMKEREKKEKETETPSELPPKSDEHAESPSKAVSASTEPQMDEIQMFKLMMKAAKKDEPSSQGGTPQPPLTSVTSSSDSRSQSINDEPSDISSKQPISPAISSDAMSHSLAGSTTAGTAPSVNEGARLLSLLSQSSPDPATYSQTLPKATTPSAPPLSDSIPVAVSRMFPPSPGSAPAHSSQPSDRGTVDLSSPTTSSFNPPAGSRLLAFGSRAHPSVNSVNSLTHKVLQSADSALNTLVSPTHHGIPTPPKLGGMTPPPGMSMNMLGHGPDMIPSFVSEGHIGGNSRATPSDRSRRSYSPYANAEEIHEAMRLAQVESLRRSAIPPPDRSLVGSGSELSSPYVDQGGHSPNFSANAAGYDLGGTVLGGSASLSKGSRFAKFFDNKNREVQPHIGPRRTPGQPGLMSTPPPLQRQDSVSLNGMSGNVADNRTMEDLFAMLQNSTQHHRASPQLQQTGRIPSGGNTYGPSPIDIQALQQQQQQQHFAQQNARLDSLYDSRLDDRSFVPDGLVPGLRPAPRPRSREPTQVLFNEQLDDPLHFNVQRLQQQRSLEQMYPGQVQPFNHQSNVGRVGGINIQQPPFRGGPSQMPSLNIQPGPSQRLPPGLANLGGRPPHDPSQYINAQLNPPPSALQSQLQQGGSLQQNFNGLGGNAVNFNGPMVTRGPVPQPHHQNLPFNQINGLGPGNPNVDLRSPNQVLGLGAGGVGGGLRGVGPGFPQQQPPQLQAQQMALRQQQQHQHQHQHQPPPPHLQPHMLQHGMLPPHLQQQQNLHVGNTQGTQDLMALLMGGQRD